MKVISTKVKTTKNNLSKAGIVKGLRMMSFFPRGALEDPDFIWSILRQTIMMGCGKLVYQSDTVCLHLMLTHSLMHLQREGERQLLSVSNKKQVSADTLTPLLPDMNCNCYHLCILAHCHGQSSFASALADEVPKACPGKQGCNRSTFRGAIEQGRTCVPMLP